MLFRSFADLFDYMDLAEEMVRYVVATVLREAPEEMAFLGQFVDKVSIQKVLEGIGVKKIVTVDPLDLEASVAAVKECADIRGVKAIIFKSPCIAITKPSGKMEISEKCIQCKKCIREIGCPAIILKDGKVAIDESLCTGCGLCAQICPVGAIGGACNE